MHAVTLAGPVATGLEDRTAAGSTFDSLSKTAVGKLLLLWPEVHYSPPWERGGM